MTSTPSGSASRSAGTWVITPTIAPAVTQLIEQVDRSFDRRLVERAESFVDEQSIDAYTRALVHHCVGKTKSESERGLKEFAA